MEDCVAILLAIDVHQVVWAAGQGTQLSLQASGPDAEDALTALDELVRQGFGEMNTAESSESVATDENRQAG